MKTIYVSVVLFLLILVGFLTLGLMITNEHNEVVQKSNIKGKEVKIIFTSDIDTACKNTYFKMTIGGCYINNSSLIYINTKISRENIDYVLFHEIGHWLTEHEDISIFDDNTEKAADSFETWVDNGRVNLESEIYFDKLWSNLSL